MGVYYDTIKELKNKISQTQNKINQAYYNEGFQKGLQHKSLNDFTKDMFMLDHDNILEGINIFTEYINKSTKNDDFPEGEDFEIVKIEIKTIYFKTKIYGEYKLGEDSYLGEDEDGYIKDMVGHEMFMKLADRVHEYCFKNSYLYEENNIGFIYLI